ncbi:MAG: hypothetical protein IJC65_05235, partial [Oscillospiraceae bacterium]|nr:hypothetical protein [Oscillospiraceae bacterium]
QTPLQRLLILIQPHRVYITKQRIFHLSWCIPYGAEFVSKVLGKEFEEQPFFKRVFLKSKPKTAMCVA